MKNIKNILIIALLVVIGIFILISYNSKPIDITPYQTKIDSLELANSYLKSNLKTELNKVEEIEVSEDHYKKLADSLAIEIKKPHTCPEVVELQEQQIIALESTLERCKETKGIYRVAITKCEEIVTNTETIVFTERQLQNAHKKLIQREKKRAFLWGMGAGGAAVLLLFLL